MSNIRFLDNVLVTATDSSGDAVSGGFPRVVFAGETKTVLSNTNAYAYEVFNKGTINIQAGTSVEVGGITVYSHGLLRMESKFVNEGKINVNGILEIGDIFTL